MITRAAQQDQVLRDFVEAARALTGKLTELVAASRGNSQNNILWSGTVMIPAGQPLTLDFAVPFASVAINSTQFSVTAEAAPARETAPAQGVGVFQTRPDQFMCVPLVGNVLTLYGDAADPTSCWLGVSSRPWPPSCS